MDLRSLRSKRLDATEQARAIADAAQAAGRSSLTTSERAEFDRFMKEAEGLRDLIAREERLAGEEAHLATLRNVGIRPEPDGDGGTGLGLSSRDRTRYSLHRAIRALATKDFRGADRELEESDRLARETGREPRGLFLPTAALLPAVETRAIEKSGTGGNLVAQDLLAASFIDLLRPATRVLQAGATVLAGLRGDVAIPRRTAAATPQWLAESGDVSASTPTFDVVTMQPRTLAARVDVSRKMLLQSTPATEDITRHDLLAAVGQALDLAALLGDGVAPTPRGVMETPGVGLLALGPDGAAFQFADVVAMEGVVATTNADQGRLAYLVNAITRTALKTMPKFVTMGSMSDAVWGDGPDGTGIVNGHPAFTTNHLPSNLTKGTGTDLSAAIFGNFADLLIGQWGSGVEVTVDPYTLGDRGALVLRAFLDVDIAVRHPESFVKVVDIVAP